MTTITKQHLLNRFLRQFAKSNTTCPVQHSYDLQYLADIVESFRTDLAYVKEDLVCSPQNYGIEEGSIVEIVG